MWNAGTIRTLTNSGSIGGGNGGAGNTVALHAGRAGVSNFGGSTSLRAGGIATLTNSGKISGGNGGFGFSFPGFAGGGTGGAARVERRDDHEPVQ